MKIAIIGFGWLGLPLGKNLLNEGHEVVGTTTTESKIEFLEKSGFGVVALDLTQVIPQKLNSFFDNTAICILNFPPKRNLYGANHTFYGQQLLKATELFPSSTKFIFVSSTGIYPDSLSIAKEDEFDRSTLVQENHLAYAEEMLHQKLKERLTIIRMAGLIGDDRQIAKYFAGKTNLPNGNAPINLIHLKDCIGIIQHVIQSNFWGETFNGCASHHPTKNEYYTLSCEKLNLPKPSFDTEAQNSIQKLVDNQKSKTILGYEYQFDNPLEFIR